MAIDYSQNALVIYKNLYLSENETTPEDVHDRVAKAISLNDSQYQSFKNLLNTKTFRPNTPCLINAGINHNKTYNNNYCACFIFGLEDDMLSIIDMWKTAALIYSSGGGMGANIGRLREKGGHLSKGGYSSGPISFLKVIQSISETVKSGGRSRRSANLFSMKYNHPDILEYINCKTNFNLSAMNISILIDDDFFNKLKNNEDIDLISPNQNIKTGTINSKILWDEICNHAWKTGDPGLLFYDHINKKNPFPSVGDVTTCNPCGEVSLPDFIACNLGSINLNNILSDDMSINWELFANYISTSVKFLNNVIDKTGFPHPKFETNMKMLRPIGLGIMGFADILFKKKIGYDTEEAIELFEKICQFLTVTAYRTSIKINSPKVVIPKEDEEHFYNLLLSYGLTSNDIEDIKQFGISNTQVSCIAPTGCLTGDTLIATNNGLLYFNELAIDYNIINDRNKWVSQDLIILQESNTEYSNQFYMNDITNNIRIITTDGYEICGSVNTHRIKVIDQNGEYIWKYLNAITKNDLIPIKVGGHELLLKNKPYVKLETLQDIHDDSSKDFKQPNELTEDLSYIIGYSMGDENIFHNGIRFIINNNELIINKNIQEIMKKYFKLTPYIEHLQEYMILKYDYKDLNLFLKLNGFTKTYNNYFRPIIPLKIRQSKTSVLCSFLKGLFDAGFIIKNNNILSSITCISTEFELFAKEIQNVLLLLGITTKIYKTFTIKPIYNIQFRSKEDATIFKEKIGFTIEYKNELLNEIDNDTEINHPILWKDFLSMETDYHNEDNNICNRILKTDFSTLSIAKKLINNYPKLKNSTIGKIINNNMILVPIYDIKESKELTMDISVPNNNMYIANGFISHNSISISCDCSYAFEPCFALVWEKKLVDRDEILYFTNPIFEKEIPTIINESGKTRTEILKDIKYNHGSIQNIPYINQSLKNIYKVAHDISPESRIKMQSAGQKYITMAISSTCNLPNSATKEDIDKIYKLAYKSNLKGITIYRDGCLNFQPVQFGKKEKNKSNNIITRPMVRNGKTIEIQTPHGKLYLTGNIDENNNLIEIFIRIGKQGTLTSILLNSLGRVISKGLQHGISAEVFTDTLIDTQGESFWIKLSPTDIKSTNVSSIIDAIAKLINIHFLNSNFDSDLEKCPACNQRTLSKTIGCRGGTCISCGYSHCS